MSHFLKNLGLEVFTENENLYTYLVRHVLSNGNAITTYYNTPYLNLHLGWVQLIARLSPHADGQPQFAGLDVHCAGLFTWDLRIVSEISDHEISIPPNKALLVKGANDSGTAVVHVVNADVLPSFSPGEFIRLQVVAFPELISYYPDAKAYDTSESSTGKAALIGENRLFPTGLFCENENVLVKSLCEIRGIVKKILPGIFKLGEETFSSFIDCIVETQFGDIEILHSHEAVKASQRDYMKVGATVYCMCYLSGDPAINEYANGIILDTDHHLRLLAYSLSEGDPERMRSVLADHFVYHSESAQKHIENIDDFFVFVKDVKENAQPCHPHYATVVQCPNGENAYPVGTHCLALTYGDSQSYSSIVFIDTNTNNKISRIYLSNDSRYRFRTNASLFSPTIPRASSPDTED